MLTEFENGSLNLKRFIRNWKTFINFAGKNHEERNFLELEKRTGKRKKERRKKKRKQNMYVTTRIEVVWWLSRLILGSSSRDRIPGLDEGVWHEENRGTFTVRSAYRMILRTKLSREGWLHEEEGTSNIQESKQWSAIWHLRVPSKLWMFVWRLEGNRCLQVKSSITVICLT